MKKYKLKYQYIPLLIAIFVLLPLLALSFFYNKSLKPQEVKEVIEDTEKVETDDDNLFDLIDSMYEEN